MTLWQIAEALLCIVVYPTAWIRGGHPERLGVGLLLLDQLISMDLTFDWRIEHFYLAAVAKGCGLLLVFGWLGFRTNRWWPLVLTAALILVLSTYVLTLTEPALSHFAAASARVGLWSLIHLVLLLGVWERWLAGEPPAGPAAWAKAARATAARRGRKARPAVPRGRSAPSGKPRSGASTEARGA